VIDDEQENDLEAVSEEMSERTCVGCRRKDDAKALLRLAVSPEPPYVAPDIGGRLGSLLGGGRNAPGRGLSVHPRRECIRLAVERGGIARSLRRSVTLDAAALTQAARSAYVQRTEGLLLAAGRRRLLTMGTDATRQALFGGGLAALVVASDAAGRREELVEMAERIGCHAVVFSTKSLLGRLFGREEVGVIGTLEAGNAAGSGERGPPAIALSEAE